MSEIQMREHVNSAGPEFYKGLLIAQMAIDSTAHDAQTTGGARYSYASTEGVMRDGRAALHKGEMVLIRGRVKRYPRAEEGGGFLVVTYFRLVHISGQWIEFSVGIPAVPNRGMGDDKATGSAITYATRYALVGVLCLPRVEKGADPEEHDDKPGQRQQGPQNFGPQQGPPQGQQRQDPKPPPGGFKRNSTSWSPDESKKLIHDFWVLTGELGDQPPESNLEEAAKKGREAIAVIGAEAKTALVGAMLRTEKAIIAKGQQPERPVGGDGKPVGDLSKLHYEKLKLYAVALINASSVLFGGSSHAQEGEPEA